MVIAPWRWHLHTGLRWVNPAAVLQRASMLSADVSAGMGLPLNMELNMGIPFKAVIHDTGQDGESFAGPGDIRVSLLYAPLMVINGGFGLLAGASLYIPAGRNDRLLGEGSFSFKGFAVFEWAVLGAVFGINAGYMARDAHFEILEDGSVFEQDDEFLWGARVKITGTMDVAWSAEVKGSAGPGARDGSFNHSVWFGGGFDFPAGYKRRAGLSCIFLAGDTGPGVMIGFELTVEGTGADEDGDGVKGKKDKCPLMREDKDGFMDGDGCPDLDNDKDENKKYE
jgi:hypothetical protein